MRLPILVAALSLACLAPTLACADPLERALETRCALDARLSGATALALDDPQGFEASELRSSAWRVGLTAPAVHALVLRGGDDDALAAALARWVDARSPSPEFARCAVERRGELLAIALAPRALEVCAASATSVAAWSVAMPRSLRDAQVVATTERAEVLRTSIADDGTVALPLDPRRRWTLQVLAETPSGPSPFATWRFGDDPRAAPATEAIWSSRQVLGAINALRRAASLEPLRRDPLLDDVAARHASTLARRALLAHTPSPGDTPVERLRASGIVSPRVAENLARGRTLTEAHESLLRSPSHRANLLDGAVDTVGVGIARSGAEVYLVEVFTARITRGE